MANRDLFRGDVGLTERWVESGEVYARVQAAAEYDWTKASWDIASSGDNTLSGLDSAPGAGYEYALGLIQVQRTAATGTVVLLLLDGSDNLLYEIQMDDNVLGALWDNPDHPLRCGENMTVKANLSGAVGCKVYVWYRTVTTL